MRSSEARTELIQVRVASAEKRKLIAVARRHGMSLSEFLRQSATEATQRSAA